MRRTYRKNNFKELNRQIVLIGLIFIVFVALGSYLNKIWPSYQDEIIKDISFISEYYNSREGIKEAILSNLKIDLGFMTCVAFFSLSNNFSSSAYNIYAKRSINRLYYK